MQSHEDTDARIFLRELEARAANMVTEGRSQIAGGKPGEKELAAWKWNGISVRQLPDDEQGILRISIGGGSDTPLPLNYVSFRGDHSKCVDLLRDALNALANRTD